MYGSSFLVACFHPQATFYREKMNIKNKNVANPAGNPNFIKKYSPDIPQKMIDFFVNAEPFRMVNKTIFTKNGQPIQIEEKEANPPPHITKFARSIKITAKTIYEWAKEYSEMAEALELARDRIKEILIENGLNGLYNSNAFIFVAKNQTDMRDKQEIEHSGELNTRIIRLPAKKEVGAKIANK